MKPITDRAKTGRCLSCSAKARYADPLKAADHRRAAARGAAKRKADPAQLAALRSCMKANRCDWSPDLIAKANASRRATVMGWCPAEYAAFNRKLRRAGFSLDDRKRMIAEEVARVDRERLTSMTPLERQLDRLRNGAQLVAKHPLRRADHPFTLGGVATGQL